MPIVNTAIAAQIKSLLEGANPNASEENTAEFQAFADGLADIIATAIKSSTVTVPGEGLASPAGPVTGISLTGSLS